MQLFPTFSKGPFNNYVDKMRVEGVKNICFCPHSGYKNCQRGGRGGQKMAKFFRRSCWMTPNWKWAYPSRKELLLCTQFYYVYLFWKCCIYFSAFRVYQVITSLDSLYMSTMQYYLKCKPPTAWTNTLEEPFEGRLNYF